MNPLGKNSGEGLHAGHHPLNTLRHYVKLNIADIRRTRPPERDEWERGRGARGAG